MSMLNTSKKNSRKVVAVIRNEHTKAQMSALDDEWVNHKGPVMTLAETLAYAAKRDEAKKTRLVEDVGTDEKTIEGEEVIPGEKVEFKDVVQDRNDKKASDDDKSRSTGKGKSTGNDPHEERYQISK